MRGGPWDAGQAIEEIAAIVAEWADGLIESGEALRAIREALIRNNFGGLLTGSDEEDELPF
ncbi:hypothetical protein CSW25_07100 [Thermus scotoductus]|uniref:Uncharacterized protein n=1 Tax=Thermus scotoductus TaxID=37636 RepID=A0A430UQU7_THESC|nr:hypothetical protein [Thermus scotoductus]RTG98119.1 hypothetical protein CSW49_01595 [Thermus scotoductus]RTH06659.1 hypothetical protein CSW45_01475 [Thermus scotoductus]RTH12666.1 hypothetical protein CSW46_01535 [Thermus scotoductus]RTH13604.1 hypothetical protein CSW44_01475 [Thermus scotoductus]RTH15607.1 hypothetical protein CSW39_11325 [Thermus scotoductus]